jgi:RimJ/RimL family protein N-acetyltransferase
VAAEGDDPILTTRLTLRPIRPEDASDLFSILRDPAIGLWTGDEPPPDVTEVRRLIEAWGRGPEPGLDERWLNWFARTHAGDPVGHLQATVHGSSAALAWVVATPLQRRGYASEAALGVIGHLRRLNVVTFTASIAEGHAASEGVARRLGMVPTAQRLEGERVWRLTS